MFCAVLAFIGGFNHFKRALLKYGTDRHVPSIFRDIHSIAACYLHFASNENTDDLHNWEVSQLL